MKFVKSALLEWFVISAITGILLLTATGCNKAAAPASNHPALSPEQAKEQRLAWNLKTLVEAYDTAGHTNPKWDEPARRALTEFARSRSQCVESNEAWGIIISTNCIAAMDAGCDDPMVNYLFIKFAMDQTNSRQAFTDAFCQTAREMQKSTYPPVRKFYAAQRAVDQLFYDYGTNVNKHPVILEIEPLTGENLLSAIADKTMPVEEAVEACEAALSTMQNDKKAYSQAYHAIEKPLFDNWPDQPLVWLLKGNAYLLMAWQGRGGGYADKVSEEGWKLFFERLAVAENALTNAWRLDPTNWRIPTVMIRIDEGRQKDRADMESWFQRAMAFNPNNYLACSYKLHYLYPQWYGSRDDMIVFGKECVASKVWGGTVPLILSDAHREYWLPLDPSEEKTNYWKQPDVWPDIKVSFERFFELNPNATNWYHNYTWYAYHCEQWDKLNELIPKLGPVSYNYFGGKDEFDKMVRLAKEHAGGSRVEENK